MKKSKILFTYHAKNPTDGLVAADSHIGDAPADQQGTVSPDTDWQRVYYYSTDHIGSSRLVMNQNAEIAERLMYLPTGEVFKDELNTTLYHSDFLFSGKELDAETGNYYYGARYLAPRIGIWLSPDPLELKYPGVSSYAFCHGNPVNRIDMLGLYDTEAEAAKAASSYQASYYQDTRSGKWFVALNEYGNGAYISGGTMTRDFGTKDNLSIKGFYNTNFAPYSHFDFVFYNQLMQGLFSNASTAITITLKSAKPIQPILKAIGASSMINNNYSVIGERIGKVGNIAGGIAIGLSLLNGYLQTGEDSADSYADALFGIIGLSNYGIPISLFWTLGGKKLSKEQVRIQMETGIIGLPSTLPSKY